MGSTGTPMLFLPPRPPLQLPAEGSLLIGRSSECQLRLNDADTSRRHAEILCRNGTFTVHDLGSTNGTQVNGRSVEKHVLRPGDRIGIGEASIVFCQVDTETEVPADEGAATAFREPPAEGGNGDAFRGDLAQIPPYAVIQILELGRKTGELVIDGDAHAGRLWLRLGHPVHAETKGQVGFDAALSLVNVASGSFSFEPNAATPEPTIEASVTELLLEASRLLDEAAAGV